MPTLDPRRVLLSAVFSTLTALVVSPGTALAQETAPPESDEETPREIVVTGTRITKPDYETSNPIVSVDSSAVRYSGYTNLTDFLRELPALTGSQDSNDSSGGSPNNFIGGTGLNLLNLRNLGLDRTLVLVNGRRHVATLPGSAAIDINTIPTDMIERIDVTTGGASAIYGADGVSGVVNFVMRDDFEGFAVRTQYGAPEAGGNAQRFVSLTAGKNFADERGNIAVAVEYSHDSLLSGFDRDYTGLGEVRFVRNPNDPFDDPTIPDRIPLSNLGWFESGRGGAVDTDFDFFANFDGSTDAPWDPGNYPDSIQGFTYAQGGSATPTGGYSGDILPRVKKLSTNVFGHFDLTDRARIFTELKYVDTDAFSVSQPTFDYYLFIEGDNPFIPPNIAAAAGGGPVLVTRDNFDFGRRAEDINRKTYRGVLGVEGDLASWVRYEVSAVYGETDVDALSVNNRYNDRFAAALDAVIDPDTGQPTCRSNLDPGIPGFNTEWQGWALPTSFTPGAASGCAPINIFGDGSPSQEALDWIMVDSLEHDVVKQKVATAYLSGNFDPWFKTPGGSVGFAAGAEWRRESADAIPALEDRLGITFGNMIDPTHGAYEVSEFFAEVDVPILEDKTFAHRLNVDAAIRLSDYTTVGSTETWKVGLLWAPVPDISLRATRADAVRAPNISELFSPDSQTFLQIDDPCDGANLNLGTQYRADNCAALLAAAGYAGDPSGFIDPNIGISVPGVFNGNPNLLEETAESETLGMVLRPRFARGLALSVDYYDIDLTSAINTLDPQDLAAQCVDLPTIDNQFCDLITRQNGGADAGGIIDFTIQPVNVAAYRTKGYDYSVSYTIDPSLMGKGENWGVFNLRLIGNELKTLYFVNLPGADPDQDKGEQEAPRRQMSFDLLWSRGPLLINYGASYYGSTQRYTTLQREGEPDIADPRYLNFHSALTHDLQGRYSFREGRFSVYAGVNNLTDEQPDLGQVFYPVSALGRFYYAGVQFSSFGQ